jgi:teichoic acid transport system permease protein
MNSIRIVLNEQFKNIYMILRLSSYELKQTYANSLLGGVWIFLNPLIQITIYALVFGSGIRQGAPVNGVPFIIWMLCGLIPWFFISGGITQGSNAIHAKLATVSKMNFPLSITPTYMIMAQFYTHMILLGVLIVTIFGFYGISGFNIFSLVYFLISNFLFLLALSYVTSTLSTIVRDIHLLVQNLTRMLFYLTPIVWEPKFGTSDLLLTLMKLNPFFYIVEGYRASLIYGDSGFIFSNYSLYFWGVLIFLFVLGSTLHVKFRRQFVDYL